jgi:predicted S18 family serine protease
MKTQNRVNKMLFSNQRVELALIDDLRKAKTEVQNLSAKANGKGLEDVAKAVMKADNSFMQLLRASENAIEIAEKFIAAAKELGVDDKEAQGLINMAKVTENDAEYWIKELNASQYR